MARPTTLSGEHIIEAAKAVFLEKGFSATTAEIAERAGVSEGSLFNRWKGKFELFMAAMDMPKPAFIDELPARTGVGDPRQNLETIALEVVEFLQAALPRVVTLLSHRNLMPTGAMPADAPPLRALRVFSAYFAAEMTEGRMRSANPEIAARMFLGSLWHFCFIRMMHPSTFPLSKEAFVEGLVEQLWHGLAPDSRPTPPRRSPAARAKRKTR